ncbi:barstar family protein [Thioalkalivibrio sp.]|uniref:barstar family protein n=1 Tax=Thioalkalivibrio sp. TaxID=2093813 RepID=UPI00356AD5D4
MTRDRVRSGIWEWLELSDPVLRLDADTVIDEVLVVLTECGLDARTVDARTLSGKAALLEALHRTLELDEWFGFNWDALEEALHGPEEAAAPERVLVCVGFGDFESRAPEDAEVFLDIVRNVASTPGSGLRGCVLTP